MRHTFSAVARHVTAPLGRAAADARAYSPTAFRRDAVAGATVAAVAVPQSIAYAVIAGVPPEYGIYTVVFQCLVGSLLNSQPLLSVGPINSQSLLVASIATRAVGGPGEAYLAFVFALTLSKGLIQLAMAAGRVGSLVKYVSRSVIAGFTAGAGVLIAAGQVAAFLGFEKAPLDLGRTPYLLTFGVQSDVARTAARLGEASWRAALLGLAALAVVVVGRRISRYLPGPLIAVVGCGVLVWALGWTTFGFTRIPPIPEGLPGPSVPWVPQALWGDLVLGAYALALLGLIEAYSIGKAIAADVGGDVDANQELFGQGFTHAVTAFFSCIPGSASFSRSALNHQIGAATAFAGLFNAGFVLVAFLLLAPVAGFVPMSAIAAILFVVALGLIDVGYFRRALAASPDDAAVFAATFAATLFTPLKYAVFLGIGLNLALQLRRTATLHASRLVPTDDGHFREAEPGEPAGDVAILQLDGDLFFAVADDLAGELAALEASGARAFVVRLRRAHMADATVLGVLEAFARRNRAAGRSVWLCGVSRRLARALEAAGVTAAIGGDRVIPQRGQVMDGLREAVAAAGAVRR